MSRLADIYRADLKEDPPQHIERTPNDKDLSDVKGGNPADEDAFSIDSGGKQFARMEENQPKSMDGEVAAMLAASGGRVHLTPEDNKILKGMIDKRVLSVMLYVLLVVYNGAGFGRSNRLVSLVRLSLISMSMILLGWCTSSVCISFLQACKACRYRGVIGPVDALLS